VGNGVVVAHVEVESVGGEFSDLGFAVPGTPPSRASSRWGRHIQHQCRQTLRHREQARSHTGFLPYANLAFTRAICGSELARDEALTSSIIVDW